MYSSPAAASLPACILLWQKRLSQEQAPFMVSWAPGLLEAVMPSLLAGGDATHLPPPLGEESTQRQMGTVFPRELLFVPSLFPRGSEMTKHTCGFSAWMLSLPFVTFLSSCHLFHLSSVSLLLGSCLDWIQSHHFGLFLAHHVS